MINEEEEERRIMTQPQDITTIESSTPVQHPRQHQQLNGTTDLTATAATTAGGLISSPMDSSLMNYCYEDDPSTILSPLPYPMGLHHRAATNQEMISRGVIRSPSPFPYQQQREQQQDDQSNELKLPKEILTRTGESSNNYAINEDIDTKSVDVSLMDYTFADEEMTAGVAHYNGDVNDPNNTTLLNSTINTLERYDHHDSLKYYSEETGEEEKQEISKPDTAATHYSQHKNYEASYEELPIHKSENKVDYIQELYRKCIAANNVNSSVQPDRPSVFEMMSKHASHEEGADDQMIENKKGGSFRTKYSLKNGYTAPINYKNNGFVPDWLLQSTPMIKFVIVISTALLMGSIALIAIALSVSLNSDGRDSTQQSNFQESSRVPTPTIIWDNTVFQTNQPSPSSTSSPSSPSSPSPQPNSTPNSHISSTESPIQERTQTPSIYPVATPLVSHLPSSKSSSFPTSYPSHSPSSRPSSFPIRYPSYAPSSKPSSFPTYYPSYAPSPIPSQEPTALATSNPSSFVPAKPSSKPSISPSLMPSPAPIIGVFYVTSRNRYLKPLLPKLHELPQDNNAWMINLGNWNPHGRNRDGDRCPLAAYTNVAKVYSESSIPVLFVPGDNEWNNCNDYKQSESIWKDTFVGFESKQAPFPFEVTRQSNAEENFFFINNKVIYIGLNMVDGRINKHRDWDSRLKKNIIWVHNIVRRNIKSVEVVVIYGNSGNIKANSQFFTDLANLVQKWNDLLVVYIKESNNESRVIENYMQIENFMLVNLKQGIWPPAKFSINPATNSFTFDDRDWFSV